jgi:DtxR family Mn-dependent transcriptional regulator
MQILEEAEEEILEGLWTTTQETGRDFCTIQELGVADAERAVAELARKGYLTRDGERIALAAAGLCEAERTVRRHRLAERLLIDVLDVKGELAEQSACRMEHMLHAGIDDKICTLLGHPRVCPHGKPIPPGPCCAEHRQSAPTLVAPLSRMRPGQRGTIAWVHSDDSRRLAKLLALGILPGAKVSLIGRSPSYSFQVGYSQFAVDAQIAEDIHVRLEESSLPRYRRGLIGPCRRARRCLSRMSRWQRSARPRGPLLLRAASPAQSPPQGAASRGLTRGSPCRPLRPRCLRRDRWLGPR